MRILLFMFLIISIPLHSQHSLVSEMPVELPSHSLRILAKVLDVSSEVMTIQVETVVTYTDGVATLPEKDDEIIVRLLGQNSPEPETRIELNVREKIDVGALPSSYILLDYKTIN